jgi:hypothetical protein
MGVDQHKNPYSSNNENTENVQEDRVLGKILMNGLEQRASFNRLGDIGIKSLAQKAMMLPRLTLFSDFVV